MPSFAVVFMVGLGISIDEIVRTGRRKHDVQYWLEDSFAELDQINKVTIPD